MMQTEWNDERIKFVTDLWEAGLSAAQIAAEMNDGTTRSMICGKLNRMGKKRPVGFIASYTQPTLFDGIADVGPSEGTVGSKASAIIGRLKAKINGRGAPNVPLKIVHDAEDIKPLHISLMDLKNTTCRWPYVNDDSGEPTTYCGCQTKTNSPYCYGHHMVAYKPARSSSGDPEEHNLRVAKYYANRELQRRRFFRENRA